MSTLGLAPRRAALAVLDGLFTRRRPIEDGLVAAYKAEKLDDRDRGLARQLALITLRERGRLDAVVSACLQRKLPAKAARARLMLSMGAAQLLLLDIPDHAAISTMVELANRDLDPAIRALAPLVNAVLRRIAREGRAGFDALDPSLNLPAWLRQRWRKAYGDETVRSIAAVHGAPAPLDLSPRSAADRDWLNEALPDALALPQGSLRLRNSGSVEALPGFDAGRFWVQDAAATLPALLLNPRPGETIYDLCAAPGGKTLQLAAAGAKVVALDRAEKRLSKVRANLDRAGLDATLVAADAALWQAEPADAILLDAPCSATGTIRRNLDVPYLKRVSDIVTMAEQQSILLDHAADLLRPDGRLVYCVCSLEPEEGAKQIDGFLATHPEYRRDKVMASELPGLEAALTKAGDVRILPSHWADSGGIDGFFIARLRRAP